MATAEPGPDSDQWLFGENPPDEPLDDDMNPNDEPLADEDAKPVEKPSVDGDVKPADQVEGDRQEQEEPVSAENGDGGDAGGVEEEANEPFDDAEKEPFDEPLDKADDEDGDSDSSDDNVNITIGEAKQAAPSLPTYGSVP
jgi:hypothetical protein